MTDKSVNESTGEKRLILIADDAEINREMIRFIFEEQYEVLEAKDGEETIAILNQHAEELAVLFLDLIMPKKSGMDVLEYMQEKGYSDFLPVIMITGEATPEAEYRAYELGASDIIYKPFEPKVVMRRTMNITELFNHRRNLENMLEERTKELMESREQLEQNNAFLINALGSVVEFRSLESGEHIRRVKQFTGIILEYVRKFYPEYGLTQKQISLITQASTLHDLGKIAIADAILLKPGRLTKDEFEEMKKHTVYGCEILERFKQGENEFYRYCYDICRYHHERYDGNGYPDNLVGEDIPIWAQVVSIVDVYDALVSKRVYKPAYDVREAVRMIREGECGIFSDKILDCFDLAKEELFAITQKEFIEDELRESI